MRIIRIEGMGEYCHLVYRYTTSDFCFKMRLIHVYTKGYFMNTSGSYVDT